jgi:subtilisin family serine protease
VAAAGNDSFGQRRMEPRLPARFESVLGVAATTVDPDRPAPYSNLGDESELGDHVATFGGSIDSHDQPERGVIGIYAGEFPSGKSNDTGWAYWSGTSFATALVSGMAANVWAGSPDLDAGGVLAAVHAAAQAGNHYVPELRAPSIGIDGRWR